MAVSAVESEPRGWSGRKGGLVGASGRLYGKFQLPEKKQLFATAFAQNGGDKMAALRAAGYAEHRSTVSQLLQEPDVQRAIQAELSGHIKTDLAARAAGVMRRLLDNDDTPSAVRFQAAKWCLEHGGYRGAGSATGDDDEKPLTEMSLNELQAYISAGNQALKAMHEPKDITPDKQTIEGEYSHSAQHSAQPEPDGSIFD